MINTSLFLHSIRIDQDFRNKVIEEYPDLSDDIKSFVQNPRCKCRKTIIEYINNNKNSFGKSAKAWESYVAGISEKSTIKSVSEKRVQVDDEQIKHEREINRKSSPTQRTNISGDVYELPPEPQAYKELISKLHKDRAIYRSCNVMESEKDGKKIWLVFFV